MSANYSAATDDDDGVSARNLAAQWIVTLQLSTVLEHPFYSTLLYSTLRYCCVFSLHFDVPHCHCHRAVRVREHSCQSLNCQPQVSHHITWRACSCQRLYSLMPSYSHAALF